MKRIFLFNFLLMSGLSCLFYNANAQFGCTVVCPSNITVPAAPNQCGAMVTYPPANASGLCGPISYSRPSGSFFPVGTTTVTASTALGSCSFTVTVVDKQAPTISNLTAIPPSLWPPNHKMVTVNVKYASADNCPGLITCKLAVSSNEPVNSTGDGNTAPDWIIVNNSTVQLRAERKGNGDGRVYTIAVTCTDMAGNSSTSTTTVVVPHDMSGKNKSENGAGNVPMEQVTGAALTVKASPNPTRNAFSLNIESGNRSEKVTVKLFDLSGRLVESKNNINPGQVISIGSSLRAGTYLGQMQQGAQIVKMKLVKL